MSEVILRMKEQEKFEIIEKVVNHKMKKIKASIRLNLSIRQINRLINKYSREGRQGFVHGNRSRRPVNKTLEAISKKIISLAKGKYKDKEKKYLICNYKHFQFLLGRDENIFVEYSFLYRTLMKEKILSPKIHKVTRKRIKKEEILAKLKTIEAPVNIDQIIEHQIAIEDAHPRIEKAKYLGEILQMDACYQDWNINLYMALHLAVDNATGNIVGGYFDRQETLNGYFRLFRYILTKYGIPNKFLTDRRTVFIYESSKKKLDENDTLTQFAYACKNLGVSLETTSCPQRKGQIERANGTFQDRLKVELKLKNINTIEEANWYLINIFIPEYNKQFGLDLNKYESVFEPIDDIRIKYTLVHFAKRMTDLGSSISFRNKYYGMFDEKGNRICFKSKTPCLVIETMEHELFVNIDDKNYALKEIARNKNQSEAFDVVESEKTRKIYIPPRNHPWRRSNYDSFQEAFRGGNYGNIDY